MVKRAVQKSAAKRKKRPAKRKKKAPADVWFGLVINGKRTPFSLPTIEDAVAIGAGLRDQGYKIAIYNQDTDRIVRRL